MNSLIYASARDLLDRFRAKEISPVEVLQAQIERAQEVEPKINAFCDEYFDEALDIAKASEQRYMDGTARPLEGVTCAVKDDAHIAGKYTTLGSSRRDMLADHDHPMVDKLRQAGAIFHARTAVPEMCLAAVTWSTTYGVTRNPWNLHYTCGGSSGGSASALAAGTTTLATGSDIGGSIRLPSSLQGLYGFKPPFGRVGVSPPEHLIPWASFGPIARNIEDLTLFQQTIAGPHLTFPASAGPAPELPDPRSVETLNGVRVAFDLDLGYKVLDSEIERETLAAIDRLADLGAVVEEVDLNWDGDAVREALLTVLTTGILSEQFADHVANCDIDSISPYLNELISQSQAPEPGGLTRSGAVASRMYESLYRVLSDHDVFVCPTTVNKGVAADFDHSSDSIVIDGIAVHPITGWIATYPFNLLNWNPVMTVPTGRASNGVPAGMQIVGNNMDDPTVFRVAAAYSRVDADLFSGDAFPDFRDNV